MKKATAVWTVGLAVSFVVAATALVAQTQSKNSGASPSAMAASPQITPLNMKTGLWQMTMTGKYIGLPPQIAAAMNPTMNYKNCVTSQQLTRDEWTKSVAGLKCSSVTVLKSTGTDVEVQGEDCSAGNGMTAEGQGKFHLVDSTHFTGSMDVTFGGNTPFGGNGSVHMHADYKGNWIGESCPADLQ